jgi:hypothetical protein
VRVLRVLCLALLGLAVTVAGEALAVSPAGTDPVLQSPNDFGGTPIEFIQRLALNDCVFLGTVESVETMNWPSDRECSRGLGPLKSIRVVIQVEEALQGEGLMENEIVWSNPIGSLPEVGSRVIAWGDRDCVYDWGLWGAAINLDDLGSVAFGGFRGRWGSGPDIVERFRQLDPTCLTSSHFGRFDGMGLARIDRMAFHKDPPSFDASCVWLGSVVGPAPRDSVTLRYRPFVEYRSPRLSVGDTLLIPWTGLRAPSELTIRVNPESFWIHEGLAAGFGLDLPRVRSLIFQHEDRYFLPRILPVEAR